MIVSPAQIDLSTYTQFATAIATCFLPSGCNTQLIEGFFKKYLTDSEELKAAQAKDFLAPFRTALVEDSRARSRASRRIFSCFPKVWM